MHELSIALSIVEMAEEESGRQRGARVNAVHLRLGPLTGIVKAALESAFGLACEGTILEGALLVVEEIPIVGYCPRCLAERAPATMQWMACPDCGSPISEVIHGRELEVVALEMSDPETAELEVPK
jgi:hydrogenase nickel incorporation protein HypA/HybF